MLEVLAPATATAQVMLALLVWRQAALPGRRGLALSLCAGAAYFIYAAFPQLVWLLPFVLVAPLICNRAYRAGFGAKQRPIVVDVAVAVFLIGAGLAGGLYPQWAKWLCTAVIVYLFLELPLIVGRGLPDDLNAARRSARFLVLALSAGVGAMVAIASVVGQGALAKPVAAVVILGMCLGVTAFRGKVERHLIPARPALDGREDQLLRRLRAVMAEAYNDPNLSLSRLAQRLEVPEHRLRRVIHLGEGQGHFSAYLNSYRIATFKARADEELSILELALSVGYNSLSAFNRAFKASEGVTPSAFRAARKANTNAMRVPPPDTPSAT